MIYPNIGPALRCCVAFTIGFCRRSDDVKAFPPTFTLVILYPFPDARAGDAAKAVTDRDSIIASASTSDSRAGNVLDFFI